MPLNRAGSLPQSGVQEAATGEPVGAEAVEDRTVEAAHGGEGRVVVQRVAVARQPVDQRLVGAGLQLDGVVGVAVRGLVRVARRTAVAAPAALAADVGRHAGVEQRLAGVDEGGLALGDDHRALALVVDAGDLAHGLELTLHRDLPVQGDALLAVDEHRRVEAADGAEGAAERAEHHRDRGQRPLLLARGVLGGELELVERVGGAAHPRRGRRSARPCCSTCAGRARTCSRRHPG